MTKTDGELTELLRDPETVKVLTTLDENGDPHTVFKGSLTVLEDGHIGYAEVLESSQTNKNMVRSLWFDKKVTIVIGKGDGISYQIKGKPSRCLVGGPIFKRFLDKVKEKGGAEADIQTVWLILPETIRNESPHIRIKEEEEKKPFLNKRLNRFL